MDLNKIYTGNCLDIMNKWDAECIDLIITSPPYDNLRKYKGYSFDFENIARQLYRILKDGGVMVWIVGDQTKDGDESGTSFRQALGFKEIGFKLFDTMIYQKQPHGAVGSNKTYWPAFEYMFVLVKGGFPDTINLIKDRKNKTTQTYGATSSRKRDGTLVSRKVIKFEEYGRRTNVWYYLTGRQHSTNDEIAFKHPAIFPEKLAEDHIISWSNKGDIILDPMCGSGTVPKMAILNNRKYIGIDISKEYTDIANRRIKDIKPRPDIREYIGT